MNEGFQITEKGGATCVEEKESRTQREKTADAERGRSSVNEGVSNPLRSCSTELHSGLSSPLTHTVAAAGTHGLLYL